MIDVTLLQLVQKLNRGARILETQRNKVPVVATKRCGNLAAGTLVHMLLKPPTYYRRYDVTVILLATKTLRIVEVERTRYVRPS